MQKEFIPLVEDMVRLSEHYFRRRLVAIYLHGSVAMGDAVPYVSDLDSYLVLSKNWDGKIRDIWSGRKRNCSRDILR